MPVIRKKTSATIEDVADTALWVAHYRLQETQRPDALFKDSLAAKLLDERSRGIAETMKATAAQTRFNVVMRTVIIDRFINELAAGGTSVVLNLGAGLDTRPYRMNLAGNFKWIEVDQTEIIEMKEEKLRDERPTCDLRRISLDLANRNERQKLFAELRSESRVIVLTEGLLPYLSVDQVSELAEDISAQPNFEYWIADYMSPLIYPYLRGDKGLRRMAKAPFKFFPEEWFGFFESRGWDIAKVAYIPEEARKHGRKFPSPWWSKLLFPFVSKKTRLQYLHSTGYMILQRRK